MNKLSELRTHKSSLFYVGVFVVPFIICALILTLTKPSWIMKLNHKNELVYSWPLIISFCTGISSLSVLLSILIVKKAPKDSKKKKEAFDPN